MNKSDYLIRIKSESTTLIFRSRDNLSPSEIIKLYGVGVYDIELYKRYSTPIDLDVWMRVE